MTLFFSEENRIKFSVEVEKVGRDHEEFIPYADLVLVSKVGLRTHTKTRVRGITCSASWKLNGSILG